MARQRSGKSKTAPTPPVVHPNAAGIDLGATEIFVAVPADRDESPIRSFQTFTQDLYALADWLQQCGIQTVAMESTGVYWVPLFQILARSSTSNRPVCRPTVSQKSVEYGRGQYQ